MLGLVLREIFSDADDRLSSKRVLSTILVIAAVSAVFIDKDPTQLIVLAGIIMTSTEIRNFKK